MELVVYTHRVLVSVDTVPFAKTGPSLRIMRFPAPYSLHTYITHNTQTEYTIESRPPNIPRFGRSVHSIFYSARVSGCSEYEVNGDGVVMCVIATQSRESQYWARCARFEDVSRLSRGVIVWYLSKHDERSKNGRVRPFFKMMRFELMISDIIFGISVKNWCSWTWSRSMWTYRTVR